MGKCCHNGNERKNLHCIKKNDDETEELLPKSQKNKVLEQRGTSQQPWYLRNSVIISVFVLCLLIALAVFLLRTDPCDDWALPTLRNRTAPSLCDNCRMSFHWSHDAGISDSFYKICSVAQVAQAWNCSLHAPQPHDILASKHNGHKKVPADSRWDKYFTLSGAVKHGLEEQGQERTGGLDPLPKTMVTISTISDESDRRRKAACAPSAVLGRGE